MVLLPGITPVLSLVLCAISVMGSLRLSLLLLVATSPLTTVAVLSLDENTVQLYQLLWLVLAIKMILSCLETKTSLYKPWIWFLSFCFCSIALAIFPTDALVINPDNELTNVRFSFQQLTQWGYLFIAVTTVWFVAHGLKERFIQVRDVFKALDVGLVLVLSVAFLQFALPADAVTELFRNSAHVSFIHEGSRVSSTFSEPSMLSAFLVPMTALHCVRMISAPSLFSFVLIVLSAIIAILSQSSSALIGFAVLAVVLVGLTLSQLKNGRIAPIGILCLTLGMFILLILIFGGVFDRAVGLLIEKLRAENISGIDRGFSMDLHWRAFLEHMFVGVGWGTVRSKDLLTTWLAELGITGFTLFLFPFLKILLRLCGLSNERAEDRFSVFSYLVVAVAILFVSVSEPYYLSFWIIAGTGYYLTNEQRLRESKNLVNSRRDNWPPLNSALNHQELTRSR